MFNIIYYIRLSLVVTTLTRSIQLYLKGCPFFKSQSRANERAAAGCSETFFILLTTKYNHSSADSNKNISLSVEKILDSHKQQQNTINQLIELKKLSAILRLYYEMLKVEYSHFQDAKKKRRGNSGERDLSENIPSESVSVRWNKNALRKLWNVSCRDFIPVADLWRIYQGHIQNNIRKKFSYENSSFVLDFMVEPWSADRCEPTSRFFDDSQTGSNEPSKFGYQSDELKVTGLDDEDIIQTCSSSTYYIHLEENLQLSNEYPIYQLFHDVLFVPSQLTTYWDSQWMKIFLDRVHLHLDIDSLMQIVFRHLNIKGEMVKTKIEFKREESITNIRAKILSVLKQNMLDTAADEENVEFQEKFLADFYGEQTANNNNEVCTESITETLDNYCATESTNEIVLAELFEDSTLDEVDYSMKATPNLYLKPFNDSSLHVSFLPDPLPLACLELNSQLAFYLLRWLIRIMKQDFTTTTTSKLKDPLTYIETWERNEQFKYLDEIIENLMTDNYLPISRRNRWSKRRLFRLHPNLVRFMYMDLLEWKIYRSLFIPHVMLPTDCGHNGLGSSHGKTPEQARAILENIPGWSLIKAFGTQLVSFEQRYLRSRLKRKSNPTNGSPFPNSMLKIYEWILNRFIVYDRPYELYLLLRAYFPDLNELSRTTYLRVLTFSSNSRTSLFSTNKSLNRLQHLKELIYELFVGEKEGLLFLKNMKSSKFKEKCARLVLLDGNLDKSLFLQFLFEENEGSSNKIVSNDINEKLLWNFLDFWLVNFSAQFQFGGSFYAATATRTKNLSQLIPFFLLEQIQNFDKTIKRKELKELLHFMEAFYVPILGKILPQVETDFSLLCNCIALLESKENQGLKPKWNRRKRKNLLHQDLKLEIFLLRLNDLLFRTCFLMLKKEIKRTGFKSTTPWDTTTLWHLYLGVLEFTNLLKPNLQLVPFQPADIIEGRNLNFNTGFNDGLNMETYRLFSVEFLYAFITLAADCNDYYNAVQMIRYLRQFPIAFSDGHDLYELCMERHIDPMSSNHTSRRKNSSTSYVTMGDYFDSKSIGVSIISPLQMNTGSKLTIPLEFIGPFNTLEKIIRDRYYLPLFLKITQIPDLLKTLGRNSYGYLVPYYQRSTSTTDEMIIVDFTPRVMEISARK